MHKQDRSAESQMVSEPESSQNAASSVNTFNTRGTGDSSSRGNSHTGVMNPLNDLKAKIKMQTQRQNSARG
jgi:hypothetical protein